MWPFFELFFVKQNYYSPQNISKTGSNQFALATGAILGQTPGPQKLPAT